MATKKSKPVKKTVRKPPKYQWVEDKPDEAMFVDDSTEFGTGFFQPTWKQRMLNRLRSR